MSLTFCGSCTHASNIRDLRQNVTGLDEIASTLQSRASLERFRAADLLQRPWSFPVQKSTVIS
jgi:hypothetical protein